MQEKNALNTTSLDSEFNAMQRRNVTNAQLSTIQMKTLSVWFLKKNYFLKQFCLFVVQVLFVKSDHNYILDQECYVVSPADPLKKPIEIVPPLENRRHIPVHVIRPIEHGTHNDQPEGNIKFALDIEKTTIRNQRVDIETRYVY